MDGEPTHATCWWCGEAFPLEELLHLEGARLAGSPPLSLPSYFSNAERVAVLVCGPDAVRLAHLRERHDAEVAEAGRR